MSDYQSIFKTYTSTENIQFKMLNRRVVFPEDTTLSIYGFKNIMSNTPWTILSYQLYGTIDYWWILCSLNKNNNMYYAQSGTSIIYLKGEYIPLIENNLK
jgi:hypothetical protein